MWLNKKLAEEAKKLGAQNVEKQVNEAEMVRALVYRIAIKRQMKGHNKCGGSKCGGTEPAPH